MKRAQTAVPAVLLTLLALIVWYVLWISPQQRYELLFGTQTETTPEASQEQIYYSTTVGEIGQSSGELLGSQIVSNMSVSYPETRSVISSFQNQIMTATLIASEHKTVDLSNVLSDKISVEILSSSVIGNPKIKITLNNTLLYESEFLPSSRTNIEIPALSIETEGEILRITCQFNGFEFWTTQKCGFNEINVYEHVYAALDTVDSDVFYLTPESENAELVQLSFYSENTTEYPVILSINNNTVYEGTLQENQDTTLSLDGEDLDLGIDNTFSLIAQQGAEYSIGSINMEFYSVPSGMAAKYLVFDMPSEVLQDQEYVTINFNLTGILEPGDIAFDIDNTDATYVLAYDELVVGNNELQIYTNDLEENGNNMKVYSNNGRLIINELEIK